MSDNEQQQKMKLGVGAVIGIALIAALAVFGIERLVNTSSSGDTTNANNATVVAQQDPKAGEGSTTEEGAPIFTSELPPEIKPGEYVTIYGMQAAREIKVKDVVGTWIRADMKMPMPPHIAKKFNLKGSIPEPDSMMIDAWVDLSNPMAIPYFLIEASPDKAAKRMNESKFPPIFQEGATISSEDNILGEQVMKIEKVYGNGWIKFRQNMRHPQNPEILEEKLVIDNVSIHPPVARVAVNY